MIICLPFVTKALPQPPPVRVGRVPVLGSATAPEGGPAGFCPLGPQSVVSEAVSSLMGEMSHSVIQRLCVECLLCARCSAAWGSIGARGRVTLNKAGEVRAQIRQDFVACR